MIELLIRSLALGVALAMDAFSVSVASGIAEPDMEKGRMVRVAGVFGGFQFAMPVIGWICVHGLAQRFEQFSKYIPWIALGLLLFLGIKMIWEGLRTSCDADAVALGKAKLFLLGIATSIDALSVGFTISEYSIWEALLAAAIIGVVTLIICLFGLFFGKKLGSRVASRAPILGGIILIVIGVEIFVKSLIK